MCTHYCYSVHNGKRLYLTYLLSEYSLNVVISMLTFFFILLNWILYAGYIKTSTVYIREITKQSARHTICTKIVLSIVLKCSYIVSTVCIFSGQKMVHGSLSYFVLYRYICNIFCLMHHQERYLINSNYSD